MKRVSTIFLRSVLCLTGCTVLALCIFWLPEMARQDAATHPENAYLRYPFLIYIYVGTLPFFFALYQAFSLLGYIDANKAFSELSVKALRNIKYCAMAIISLIAAGELYVTVFMHGDRAHIVALGLYTVFLTTIIAAFAGVLQKLFQNAIEIKAENDLTV